MHTWVTGLAQDATGEQLCTAYDWLDAIARTNPTLSDLGRTVLQVTTHVVQQKSTIHITDQAVWHLQRAALLASGLPASDPSYDPLITLLLTHRLALATALASSQRTTVMRQQAQQESLMCTLEWVADLPGGVPKQAKASMLQLVQAMLEVGLVREAIEAWSLVGPRDALVVVGEADHQVKRQLIDAVKRDQESVVPVVSAEKVQRFLVGRI